MGCSEKYRNKEDHWPIKSPETVTDSTPLSHCHTNKTSQLVSVHFRATLNHFIYSE